MKRLFSIDIKIISPNREFVGDVVAIFDREETYDVEDSIDLCVNGVIIGFMQCEIKNIEVLK